MSDEGTPFPADELDALVGAAERFGSAARDWLAWAAVFEGHEPDAYRLLRELEQHVNAAVEAEAVAVVVEHVLDAIDATAIDVQAAVISTLALRIIVRRYEIDAQEDR